MKRILIGFILNVFLMVIRAYAADNDSIGNRPYRVALGIEIRTDNMYSPEYEYNIKYFQGKQSFVLKCTPYFAYTEMEGSIEMVYKYGVANAMYTPYKYSISGFCIKPGWIFSHHYYKSAFWCQSVSAVVSRTKHQLDIGYSTGTEKTVRNDLLLGAEYEFLVGLKLFDHVLLTSAFQFGVKSRPQYLFNDVIDELPSYYRYAPAQGYNKDGYGYLMLTFGLGYMF